MSKKTNLFVRIAVITCALALIVVACAPAPTVAPAPTQPPAAAPTAVPPTAVPPTATAAKPVDIEIWATPTSTQAPAPSADWIGYKTILAKLNINLKYVALPTGGDGETKLNAAAAANALPDFFMAVSTTSQRNKVIELNKQGLIAPVTICSN
jgi:ABC-type glycerol-3-phosphate transport system substrate-binding protein